MDLVGGLSSPAGPLKAILDPKRRRVKRPKVLAAVSVPVGERHRHVGWVGEAVVRVLAETHGQPMQAKEIHEGVEKRLRQAVSWSSVKNALADGVRGQSPRLERIAKGRYRIRPPQPPNT
jgi:hypothetical protein